MKNTTAVLLMALGLALPVTTFGQNADPASRPAVKPVTTRKMTVSDAARPAAPATPPATPVTEPATPATQRQRSAPPPIAAIDVNHDGILDAAEIAQASATLRALDKNGDGTLTSEELRPPTRSRLGAVDTNKDGMIDADEIGGVTQVLAKLDKDGDGKVTLDEVRSYRGPRTPRASAGMPKE